MSEMARILVRAWPFWSAAGVLLVAQLIKMVALGEIVFPATLDTDDVSDRAEICMSNCSTAGYREDSEEFWECFDRCVAGY